MDNRFKEWKNKIIYLRDKVILPDGTTINKLKWVSEHGFDTKEFEYYLEKIYNDKYNSDESK